MQKSSCVESIMAYKPEENLVIKSAFALPDEFEDSIGRGLETELFIDHL